MVAPLAFYTLITAIMKWVECTRAITNQWDEVIHEFLIAILLSNLLLAPSVSDTGYYLPNFYVITFTDFFFHITQFGYVICINHNQIEKYPRSLKIHEANQLNPLKKRGYFIKYLDFTIIEESLIRVIFYWTPHERIETQFSLA